jgi:hypothetical protein
MTIMAPWVREFFPIGGIIASDLAVATTWDDSEWYLPWFTIILGVGNPVGAAVDGAHDFMQFMGLWSFLETNDVKVFAVDCLIHLFFWHQAGVIFPETPSSA